MKRLVLLLLCALTLRADTMPITSIYDQTPPGWPFYTDIDLNGDRCGGYRDDWPCFQWAPLPSTYVQDFAPYIPPIEILDPPYEPPTVPVNPTPEPATWPLLVGMAGLLLARRRRAL